MELRVETLLPVIAKSLQDAVAPALDPENQVAQEQLKLAIGLLRFLEARIGLQHACDARELAAFIAESEALAARGHESAASRIALRQAHDMAARIGPSPAEIVAAIRQMRCAVTDQVALAHDAAPGGWDAAVAALALDMGRAQLDRERAWVMPFGFENSPDAVPPIAALLAQATAETEPA